MQRTFVGLELEEHRVAVVNANNLPAEGPILPKVFILGKPRRSMNVRARDDFHAAVVAVGVVDGYPQSYDVLQPLPGHPTGAILPPVLRVFVIGRRPATAARRCAQTF